MESLYWMQYKEFDAPSVWPHMQGQRLFEGTFVLKADGSVMGIMELISQNYSGGKTGCCINGYYNNSQGELSFVRVSGIASWLPVMSTIEGLSLNVASANSKATGWWKTVGSDIAPRKAEVLVQYLTDVVWAEREINLEQWPGERRKFLECNWKDVAKNYY